MHPAVLIGLGAAGLFFALTLGGRGYPRPERVLVLGDSHSEASWTLGGRVAAKIKEAGIPVVERVGNRGKGVPWYVRTGRLAEEVARVQPDLLIVPLGGNDAGQYSEDTYRTALESFVRIAREGGVTQIIWFGPSKVDQDKVHMSPARREIARWQSIYLPPLDVQWFDAVDYTADLPTRDGVHMRRPEYETWASRLIEGPLREVVA